MVKCAIEEVDAAVIVLNPLAPRSDIAYVSEGWQSICGIPETKAVGQELGGILQGSEEDGAVFDSVELSLSRRRACKVLTRHSRAGRPPFWCMLSLSPLLLRGELLLFVGTLQDCSLPVSRLRRPPKQKCRSASCHQKPRVFGCERPEELARPAVLELDPTFLRSYELAAASHQLVAPAPMESTILIKRLGW